MGGRRRLRALRASAGGDAAPAGRRQRGAGHPHRVGQVAGGDGRDIRGAGPGPAGRLHRAGQGAGEREVLRADRGLRRRPSRHGHRRRHRQRRRPGDRLHGRDPGQPDPAGRGRRRRRLRGDGRDPLLRRPGPGLGLAGAAAGAAPGPVPAHVGHPGRHRPDAGRPGRPDRARRRLGGHGGAAGAPGLRVPRDPAARVGGEAAGAGQGAGLHRPLHPEGGLGPGPEPHQPRRAEPGRQGGGARGGGRVPLRHPRRQGPEALRDRRHRRPPRRFAAQVPAAGGEAGPAGPPAPDMRHRHLGGGGEHAGPHRAVHPALQVRRAPHPGAVGAGLPADRGAGRPPGLRRRRERVGAGPRARRREQAGRGQGGGRRGGRRGRQAPQAGPQEAARAGLRPLRRRHPGPPGRRGARDPGVELPGDPRHDAQRLGPARRRLRGHEEAAGGQPRAPAPPARPHPPGGERVPVADRRRDRRGAGRARRAGPPGAGRPRPPGRVPAQPAPVAVRGGGGGGAGPVRGRLPPAGAQPGGVDRRGPDGGADGPARPDQGRADDPDEGRGGRVRGADEPPGRGHLAPARS